MMSSSYGTYKHLELIDDSLLSKNYMKIIIESEYHHQLDQMTP